MNYRVCQSADRLILKRKFHIWAWFGYFACHGLFVLWIGTAVRESQSGRWGNWIFVGLLLGSTVFVMNWLLVDTYRRIEINLASGVRVRSLRVKEAFANEEFEQLHLRTEQRIVTGRYGRGKMAFWVLSLHQSGGRTKELLAILAQDLSAEQEALLHKGIAAHPKGRPH